MIRIQGRIFLPLKVAAAYIGYSVIWVHKCGKQAGLPQRVYLSSRNTGYFQDELDAWLGERAHRHSA